MLQDDIRKDYLARQNKYFTTLDTLISILSAILRSVGYYEPVAAERVMGRIKTLESILEKLATSEVSSIEEVEATVGDIVGARVICDDPSELHEIVDALVKHPGLRLKRTLDYTEAPQSGGYRGFHLFVELQGVPAEIQIQTVMQQRFAENAHLLTYKFKGAVPPKLASLLRNLSDVLAVTDRLLEQIHDEVAAPTYLGVPPRREIQTDVAHRIAPPYEYEPYVPVKQFELDPKHFKSLLEKVELTAKSKDNQSKMRSLEELAKYLLGCVKCFSVYSKTRTATGELDLYFAIHKLPGTFLAEWSPYVPVECKNWHKPIGAGIVAEVVAKAEKMRVKECILFSSKGITGNPRFGGIGEVRNQFSQKGLTVMVLSLNDLQRIASGQNLLFILEEKWRQVRLLA